jgi:hypothetical protein
MLKAVLSAVFLPAKYFIKPCLKELHQALDLRASARLLTGNLGDDGLGSKTVLGNFHDDGAMLVPHWDFCFVYQEFDRIGGTLHGLHTNWDKSSALVTLDPSMFQPIKTI